MTKNPNQKRPSQDPKFTQLGSNQILIWELLKKGGVYSTTEIAKLIFKMNFATSNTYNRARSALDSLARRKLVTSRLEEKEGSSHSRCGKNRLRERRQIRVWWALTNKENEIK